MAEGSALANWYRSNLKTAIDKAPFKRAVPVENWQGILQPGKSGIKQAELNATGLDAWMKTHQDLTAGGSPAGGPISKKTMQDYIGRNQIDLTSKTYVDPDAAGTGQWFDDYSKKFENPEYLHTIAEWDPGNTDWTPGVSDNEMKKFIDEGEDTGYLPGKPSSNDRKLMMEINAKMRNGEISSPAMFKEYVAPGSTNYQEHTIHWANPPIPDPDHTYTDPHFPGTPNVLANYITSDADTLGPDGKPIKTLLIHEAQSHWNQSGRDQGYVGATPDEHQALIEERNKKLSDIRDKYDDLKRQQASLLTSSNPSAGDMDRLHAINDTLNSMEKDRAKIAQSNTIPRNPFMDTREWSNLIWRHAMTKAQEEGYGRIAWSSGDILARRYPDSSGKRDLGQQEYYDKIFPSVVRSHQKDYGLSDIGGLAIDKPSESSDYANVINTRFLGTIDPEIDRISSRLGVNRFNISGDLQNAAMYAADNPLHIRSVERLKEAGVTEDDLKPIYGMYQKVEEGMKDYKDPPDVFHYVDMPAKDTPGHNKIKEGLPLFGLGAAGLGAAATATDPGD